MSGGIIDCSKQKQGSLTTEICIIGSGCGGATAARVLAEAGRQVIVLEEGGDFTGKQLTQREAAMYDQLYMDRAGRTTEDLAITVLQGRALGGGGVINASDVVPIPREVLAHWRKHHGLKDLKEATLKPHYDGAMADLSASRIAESQVSRANQLLRAGTKKLGLRGELMMHNRVDCEEIGTCLIGCPVNAKRNPRFVAIPAAKNAGARFLIRARAVRIDGANSELKTIQVKALDNKGYHEKEAFTVKAKVVIVAANAVATPQLFLRSGIGNDHVGRNLMLQPQLPIVAVFKEKVNAFDGIPQAWAVTEHETHGDPKYGLWGFRIEAVMGTPGIVSTLLPFGGHQGKQMMLDYPKWAASLLLTPDEPSGRVTVLPSGRPLISYEHRENHKARLRQAIKVSSKIYLAAGAERVIVPMAKPLWINKEADAKNADAIGFEAATAPLLSAHQQGTVRMAPDKKRGAANPDGMLYGTKDVYAFDSSIFPTSASSHTMTPIITISRYLCARLLSRLRG